MSTDPDPTLEEEGEWGEQPDLMPPLLPGSSPFFDLLAKYIIPVAFILLGILAAIFIIPAIIIGLYFLIRYIVRKRKLRLSKNK